MLAMVRKLLIFLGMMLFAVQVHAACTDEDWMGDCPEQSQSLPGKGNTYTDKVFLTTILQVNDSGDGSSHNLYSSTWNPFSYNSNYFWIFTDGGGSRGYTYFYSLTKSPSLTSTRLGLMFSSPYPQNSPDSFQWKRSSSEENHAYILSGEYIEEWDLNLATTPSGHNQVWSKNLSSTCTSGAPIGLTISDDNDAFAFYDSTAWDSNGNTLVVYYKVTGDVTKTLDVSDSPLNFNDVHQMQLSKNGRYVHISVGQSGGFGVWDTVTDNVTMIENDGTDLGLGHRAIGTSYIYQTDSIVGCGDYIKRDLTSNPDTNWSYFFDVHPGDTSNCAETHASAFASNDWIIMERYGGSGIFADEILKVWTTSSEHFLRLAHHRSTASSYDAQPHPAVSMDGAYVLYNSDWEGSATLYVFILEMPTDGETPTVTVTAIGDDGIASEDGSLGQFTISCNPACAGETINFNIGGTATWGDDYEISHLSSITITGPSGAVTITPIDDSEKENTETVLMVLTSGTGYTVGTPSSDTINILDNDDAIMGGTSLMFH